MKKDPLYSPKNLNWNNKKNDQVVININVARKNLDVIVFPHKQIQNKMEQETHIPFYKTFKKIEKCPGPA